MQTLTIDRLARLSEEEAVRHHFDPWNMLILKWARGLALLMILVPTIQLAESGQTALFIACIFDLTVIFAYFIAQSTSLFEKNVTTVVMSFIVLQYLMLLILGPDRVAIVIPSAVILPLFHLVLRLRTTRYMALSAMYVAGGVWGAFNRPWVGGEEMTPIGATILLLITNSIFIGLGVHFNSRSRKKFLVEWRRHVSRETERTRMREELADARKIQLAMLPEGPPRVDWLDIANVSMPATEVGGDFYDYIQLDDKRIVIVIGDVAGHGVASGLVLAGIKSGLLLLRDELENPTGATEKLNAMVRDWLRWRMLASMLIAVVDRDSATVRVVSAGHPPLLRYSSKTGTVQTVGFGALPLGTRLPTNYREDSTELDDGDVLLFYTDGVTELLNFREDLFGEERLIKALERASRDQTARSMRESILDDLAHFKADTPQQDDLSLVVVRVTGVGRGIGGSGDRTIQPFDNPDNVTTPTT